MLSSLFLSATNHLLAQAGWARQRLQTHAGRTARLELAPVAEIDFSISAEGQLAEWSGEDMPEVCLRLAVAELPQLLTGGMETAMRHVRIEGNAELAEALGFVFRHLRWDAEEDLSTIVGDIAAHRIVTGTKEFVGWQQQAAQNLAANLAEYFTEEQPLIAKQADIAAFSADIDRLRDDVARLEKRLQLIG